MSECYKHDWVAPRGTFAEVHPPCPWCQLHNMRERIQQLEKLLDAAVVWVQDDCPWDRDEILQELQKETDK